MTTLSGEKVLLRIFLGESDRFEKRPLWEEILARLQRAGFSGATVLRGVSGFGPKSVKAKPRLFSLSPDLPIIIETVESEDRVRAFLPELDRLVIDGLVTLERAQVILHRSGESPA